MVTLWNKRRSTTLTIVAIHNSLSVTSLYHQPYYLTLILTLSSPPCSTFSNITINTHHLKKSQMAFLQFTFSSVLFSVQCSVLETFSLEFLHFIFLPVPFWLFPLLFWHLLPFLPPEFSHSPTSCLESSLLISGHYFPRTVSSISTTLPNIPTKNAFLNSSPTVFLNSCLIVSTATRTLPSR